MSLRQWLWLGLLASFWGSAFIFMELALPTFSPIAVVMGRMSVATLVLNALLWRRSAENGPKALKDVTSKKMPLAVWLKCGGLSIVSNLLPFSLIVWGQQHISASLASILITAAPLFTVVIAAIWTKEKLTLGRSLGVILGFAGVVVLVGPEVLSGFSLQGAGELAVLAAALSYAVAGFVGKRLSYVPSRLVSRMTATMGALIMVPLGLGSSVLTQVPLVSNWQWSAGIAVVCLGVFSTAIAYLIYYRLLAEAGVINTSLVSFLVPLSALILGAVFLQERLSSADALGMILILSGLAVLDGRLVNKILKGRL